MEWCRVTRHSRIFHELTSCQRTPGNGASQKIIFPVDFVVIDIEEDKQVPLLLGRPFLATRVALIDVKKGELTLRVGDEAMHFNLNHSLKQSEFDNVDCKIVETKVPISSN